MKKPNYDNCKKDEKKMFHGVCLKYGLMTGRCLADLEECIAFKKENKI